MSRQHVPGAALDARERELLDAVREAGRPAAEIFGDAQLLAAEDAAELGTAEEEVRTSLGGGLRPALREVGGILLAAAAVSVLGTSLRTGWSVDVDLGSAVIAASLAVLYAAWAVSRALFQGGRPAATLGVLAAAGAVAVAGIEWAADLDVNPVLARDVPVPLLGAGLLAPGLLALAAAARLPEPTLRERWDDDDWLRRFHGGLRSRLVPSAVSQGHVVEVRQAIRSGRTTAFQEYGHPLVLARQLAEADQTSRVRRWRLSVLAGTGTPLVIAGLVHTGDNWGALTTPIAVALSVVAVLNLLVAFDKRPRRTRR